MKPSCSVLAMGSRDLEISSNWRRPRTPFSPAPYSTNMPHRSNSPPLILPRNISNSASVGVTR
eukprot:scaffold4189_cov378-Prasinococcus_capsulatus_cf.AAC.8